MGYDSNDARQTFLQSEYLRSQIYKQELARLLDDYSLSDGSETRQSHRRIKRDQLLSVLELLNLIPNLLALEDKTKLEAYKKQLEVNNILLTQLQLDELTTLLQRYANQLETARQTQRNQQLQAEQNRLKRIDDLQKIVDLLALSNLTSSEKSSLNSLKTTLENGNNLDATQNATLNTLLSTHRGNLNLYRANREQAEQIRNDLQQVQDLLSLQLTDSTDRSSLDGYLTTLRSNKALELTERNNLLQISTKNARAIQQAQYNRQRIEQFLNDIQNLNRIQNLDPSDKQLIQQFESRLKSNQLLEENDINLLNDVMIRNNVRPTAPPLIPPLLQLSVASSSPQQPGDSLNQQLLTPQNETQQIWEITSNTPEEVGRVFNEFKRILSDFRIKVEKAQDITNNFSCASMLSSKQSLENDSYIEFISNDLKQIEKKIKQKNVLKTLAKTRAKLYDIYAEISRVELKFKTNFFQSDENTESLKKKLKL